MIFWLNIAALNTLIVWIDRYMKLLSISTKITEQSESVHLSKVHGMEGGLLSRKIELLPSKQIGTTNKVNWKAFAGTTIRKLTTVFFDLLQKRNCNLFLFCSSINNSVLLLKFRPRRCIKSDYQKIISVIYNTLKVPVKSAVMSNRELKQL